MRKIVSLVIAFMMALPAINVAAQDMGLLREQTIKRNNIKKLAKQEAKDMKKEGWKAYDGLLEDQIFERTILQKMKNEDGEMIFIVETGMFTTDDIGAAIKFARERAVQLIAASIGQNVADAIKMNVGTDKVTGRTLTEAKDNAMSVVEQKLRNIDPCLKMIRPSKTKPGYYDAKVAVSYNRAKAERLAAESVLRSTNLEDPELKQAVLDSMKRMQAGDNETATEEAEE